MIKRIERINIVHIKSKQTVYRLTTFTWSCLFTFEKSHSFQHQIKRYCKCDSSPHVIFGPLLTPTTNNLYYNNNNNTNNSDYNVDGSIRRVRARVSKIADNKFSRVRQCYYVDKSGRDRCL